MIPHRVLSNEIGSNGLKERVTACRKRLRVNRVTHKQPHALNEAIELFPEKGSQPDPARNVLSENEALRLTEGQEVGIT